MIYTVEMINFKQHMNYTVTFDSGLNTVQGENGAGKTTVLKAILFSLFGASAAGAKEHLTTWGETKMQVTTNMLLGELGDVTIRRGGTKAEIWKDGNLLASGQTPVTQMIEEKLGMDAKLFKSMLYAGQGETQLLLKMGAAGLQKQLETVANTDVLDKIIAKINVDNTLREGELRGVGDAEDLNALREQFTILTRDLNSLRVGLASDQTLLQGEVDKFDIFNTAYKLAVDSKFMHAKLQADLSSQQARTNLLLEQFSELKASKPRAAIPETVAAGNALVDTISKELASQTKLLQEYNAALARYESAVNESAQCLTYEVGLVEAKKLIENAAALKVLMDTANTTYHAKKKEMTASVCAACERPFDTTALITLSVEADKLASILSVATSDWGLAAGTRDEFLRINGMTEGTLPTLEAKLTYVKTVLANTPCPKALKYYDFDTNKALLVRANEEVVKLNQMIRATQEWEARYTYLLKGVEESQRLEGPLLGKLKVLDVPTEESISFLIQEQGQLQSSVEQKTEGVKVATQNFQVLQQAEQQLKARITANETKADRINILEREIALRAELQKFLRRNRAKFMEDTWSSLTNYASHLISSVTEGLIHSLSRSDSGEFYIVEGGQMAPVEELSGARKSIVGLCLRLSLAHLFYGTGGFTLLDEVTADCSEYNAARVAGMLKGLQTQVIMVTHRQSDAMNANNSIFLG